MINQNRINSNEPIARTNRNAHDNNNNNNNVRRENINVEQRNCSILNNLNNSQKFFLVLSLLSWVLFLITGWISLKYLKGDQEVEIIWTIYKIDFEDYSIYYPFQMNAKIIDMVFILTLIISSIGFIILLIKTIFIMDEPIIHGMFGQFSKFHFFPLLCVSGLFLIRESVQENDKIFKNMIITGTVFDILGLISLIFIYLMTDLNTQWYYLLFIKKGSFSCLIILM